MPRYHTEAEKRRILDHLMLNGGSIALTAEESGVSPSTLYRWLRDENSRKKADSHSYHSYHFASAPPLHCMERTPGGEDPHAIERTPGGEDSHAIERTPGGEDPLQPFIPAMIDEAQFLLDSIREAVADAPLNQRVAALVQLIDRIERMRFRRAFRPVQPPIDPMDYEIRVAHHVEKEDDLDPQDPLDDPSPDAPPQPAHRAQE